jgi:hypothetical protein
LKTELNHFLSKLLRKDLKINAGLIGRAVKWVVESILIFSSIGKIRVEGHSSVGLIKVAAIIEIWHHSIGLRESWLVEKHVLIKSWHG